MSNTNENQSVAKTNINWYPGHMAKTKRIISENINLIDVVYEVIDARIPYSSKVRDIDDIIKNKPRIMVMTKTDLCDINETNKWVKYYEEKGYVVIKMDLEKNPNVKPLLKATESLMKELDKKRENKGMLKRKYKVLVIGIPNAGKSTLINRLAGKKVVGVGNMPGVTKQTSWIRVSDIVELLDTPGILWPKFEDQKIALNLASLTAIREEVLPLYDVVSYILNTLYNYYPSILEGRYGISELSEDIYDDFEIIGKKRGCLVKGGEVDYDKVVNVILNDIKLGAIKNITFDRYDEYDRK